jgi:hypothetical protein
MTKTIVLDATQVEIVKELVERDTRDMDRLIKQKDWYYSDSKKEQQIERINSLNGDRRSARRQGEEVMRAV